jgi:hypothetical protein
MKISCRTKLVMVKRKECKSYQTGQFQWPQNRGDYAKHYGQYSGALSKSHYCEGDWMMIMEELERIDPIAYLCFASVCQN